MNWYDAVIAWTGEDGVLYVYVPNWASRRLQATWVRNADQDISQVFDEPTPVYALMREHPPEYAGRFGEVALWAETEEEFLTRQAAKVVPKGVEHRIVDSRSLPSRTWRGAWVLGTGAGVIVDVARARQNFVDAIRNRRNLLLDGTDKDYVRLLDVGTPQELAKMKLHRQTLRDLPDKVEKDVGKLGLDEMASYQVLWPEVPFFQKPPEKELETSEQECDSFYGPLFEE